METNHQFLELPESIQDVFALLDSQWRFVYVNRSAQKMSEMTSEQMLGRTIWEIFPAACNTQIEQAYRKAMTERTTVYLEHPSVRQPIWYGIHVYPMRDGIAIYARDITKRKRAEQALAESEERFRSQYQNLPMPTFTWRRVGKTIALIAFNEAGAEFSNGAIGGLIGQTIEQLYSSQPQIIEDIRRTFESKATLRREMTYTMQTNGQIKELSVTYVFVLPDLVMVHVEDITQRKADEHALRNLNETLEHRVAKRTEQVARSEQALRASEAHYRELAEQHRLLALELEHRVGNNIAGLISLMGLLRNRSRDVGDFADAVESRLRAMAQVNRLLAASGWKSADMSCLIESVVLGMRELAPHQASTTMRGPSITITPRQAFGLALILAEWFMNSCKYGVHSAPAGSLQIGWETPDDAATPKRVRLRWTERGGPPISGPATPSLGTQLTHDLTTRELGGTCTMSFPREGAEHQLEFAAG